MSRNLKQAVPFFAVSDIQRSVRYYLDGLGFVMTHKWEPEGALRWCWVEREGVAFMFQQIITTGHDSWQPSGKLGEGVSICVLCEDAIALYREFKDKGLDASEPFVGNGLWVTSLLDPDGYRIDFESYTDVPEGTKLSEVRI